MSTPTANFEEFLTNLRQNFPSLSKEEIADKIITWVDQNCVDANSEQELVDAVRLIVNPENLQEDMTHNARYLVQKLSHEIDYYFTTMQSAFDLMDPSDPDLKWIFNSVNAMSLNSKHYFSRASRIHSDIVFRIEVTDWAPAKKKMVARKFSRHFQGTAQELLAKSKPEDVSAETHAAIIAYFTQTVSSKNYKRYFKNIEKEVARPEKWTAVLRFEYRNQVAFALRALKNNFWDTLKSGMISACITFTASSLFLIAVSFSVGGVAGLLALGTLNVVFNVMFLSLLTFIASLPLIALATLHDNFLDSLALTWEIICLAIPVVLALIFEAGLDCFGKKPVLKEGDNPDLVPEPKVGEQPDPLAAVSEKSSKAVQPVLADSLLPSSSNRPGKVA